jgi:hypothetical protein
MKHTHKLRQIAQAVLDNPGITRAQLSRVTGLTYKYVESALTALETCGVLLSEDQNARLYPFNDYEPEGIPDDGRWVRPPNRLCQ